MQNLNTDRNSTQRILVNSSYMTIRLFIVLILQLYTTRVILKSLGILDFGIYNLICGFVALFGFINSAITNGIQRFYNFAIGKTGESGITEIYNAAIRIQVFSSIIIFFVVETIGIYIIKNWLNIPFNRIDAALSVFHSSVFVFVLIMIQTPYSAAILAKEEMGVFSLISILNSILYFLIAILIEYAEYDRLKLYGLLLISIQLIIFVVYFCYCKKSIPQIKLEKKYRLDVLYSMLNFSGWNILGTFGNIMKFQGVNLLLNSFCGPVVNAALGVANQVNGGLQGLVSNISISVRPQVTKSYAQGDIERSMKLTCCVSKVSCLVLYAISYPVMLEIDYILTFWLGSNNVPENTNIFVVIIVLTSYIAVLNSAVSGVIHSSGNIKNYQIFGAVINLSSLPVVYFLMKFGFGVIVSVAYLFVTMCFVQFFSVIILKRLVNYEIKNYIKEILQPIFIVVLITFIPPYLAHTALSESMFRFMIVCLISVFSTLIISYKYALTNIERVKYLIIIQSLLKILRKNIYVFHK